jgi:hypothetical protein
VLLASAALGADAAGATGELEHPNFATNGLEVRRLLPANDGDGDYEREERGWYCQCVRVFVQPMRPPVTLICAFMLYPAIHAPAILGVQKWPQPGGFLFLIPPYIGTICTMAFRKSLTNI